MKLFVFLMMALGFGKISQFIIENVGLVPQSPAQVGVSVVVLGGGLVVSAVTAIKRVH